MASENSEKNMLAAYTKINAPKINKNAQNTYVFLFNKKQSF